MQTRRTTVHDFETGYYLSNILYRSSYIIKGDCKAVVCAVGKSTQYGMAQDANNNGTADVEQMTPLRKLLEKYQNTVYKYALYLVVVPIFINTSGAAAAATDTTW